MKLKSKVLTGIIVAFFLIAGHTATIQAQGIYSNNRPGDSNNNSNESGGGIFRAPTDDEGDWGADGKEGPGAPGRDDDPIGEGILILSLLSGGYALIKRNVRKNHED